MKRLLTITLFGLLLTACQNSNSRKDQDAKIQELEKKIEQLSETKKVELEKGVQPKAKEKEITVEKPDKKEQVLKSNDGEKNFEIAKLKEKYKHRKAKYVSTDEGDSFYYIFEDEKGKRYSFSTRNVKDKSYKLLIEDESSNFGLGINPKYQNKYFHIFYQVEEQAGMGGIEDYDVVIKMILME